MTDTTARVPRRLHRWLEPELFQPFVLGIFLCLSLSEFVRGALVLSLLPTYGRSVLHFRVEWTALALSLHYLVDNLLRTPSGWLVDHVGERSVLLTGFAISTASVFGMMNAHTITLLIASLCAYGVGANVVWPSVMSGISRATPEGKRALFMSYVYIFWLLGAGLGPVIINFLVGGTYRIAFLFLLSVDAIGFLTAFALVRRSRTSTWRAGQVIPGDIAAQDQSRDSILAPARNTAWDNRRDNSRDNRRDNGPDNTLDNSRKYSRDDSAETVRDTARSPKLIPGSAASGLAHRIAKYGRFRPTVLSLVLDRQKLIGLRSAYLSETALELGLPARRPRRTLRDLRHVARDPQRTLRDLQHTLRDPRSVARDSRDAVPTVGISKDLIPSIGNSRDTVPTVPPIGSSRDADPTVPTVPTARDPFASSDGFALDANPVHHATSVGAMRDGSQFTEASTRKTDWESVWRNIKEVSFLFPGMFAQTFAVASLIPILSVYANAVLKLSGAMYSLMLVAAGSVTVIGLIPTGKLIDRIGPRTPLVVAFLTAGTGLALFPLFRTVPFTFALVCLLGASYSFILPAWNAVLDRSIDEDKKGSLWGVFMTVEGFGSAAGPYLGGLVWDRIGPSAPFWVSAVVILIMGLLYTVLPIEKRFRARSVRA
ncbi:MFS transporter [Alicyclobacillus ferrooxydans]|uniref:MFS transporter n=1 Tax=Alicyclobacillus ferrooxydans TaxID=471514 RepID=UPI0006D5735C|nr:MFS transporter [Alicyclobacillus ferrooxydans]